MSKQINKWIKATTEKNLIVVDVSLDLEPLTPKWRCTEEALRSLLQENNLNPGACVQTAKVFNNRAIGKDSSFLNGTFKFVNKDYVPPKQPVKVKPKTRVKEQARPTVSQKSKE